MAPMTSLSQAVERLRAWQTSVDKPSADHQFLADVQIVLDSLSPSDDLREGVEKLLTPIVAVGMSDASQLTAGQIREVRDAILAFITAREAAKDAEIAGYRAVIDELSDEERARAIEQRWVARLLALEAERDTLAARLEKAMVALKAVQPTLRAMSMLADDGDDEIFAAVEAVEAALADEDGSTTVPARETALHDGSEGE